MRSVRERQRAVWRESYAIEIATRCARSYAAGSWKMYLTALDRWLRISLSEAQP